MTDQTHDREAAPAQAENDGAGDRATAARALGLIDLTNLEDDCSPADIRALAARAETPHGNVAALCVWPDFVELAADLASGTGIDIATVVNFPHGRDPLDDVLAMTGRAVAAGASEIDTVIPYAALMDGDEAAVSEHVRALVRASGPARLKVILETGELGDERTIRLAARLAIEAGADFVKTSTGKVAVNATIRAARVMLQEIEASGRADVGLKPAGGIRTVGEAGAYLDLADTIMGKDWARKATFRFGASSLLGGVLEALGEAPQGANGGY